MKPVCHTADYINLARGISILSLVRNYTALSWIYGREIKREWAARVCDLYLNSEAVWECSSERGARGISSWREFFIGNFLEEGNRF